MNHKEFGSTSRLIFELAMVGSSIFTYLGYRQLQECSRLRLTLEKNWIGFDFYLKLFPWIFFQKMLQNELTTFSFKNFKKNFFKSWFELSSKGFKFVFSFSRVGIQNLISKVFHQRMRFDWKRELPKSSLRHSKVLIWSLKDSFALKLIQKKVIWFELLYSRFGLKTKKRVWKYFISKTSKVESGFRFENPLCFEQKKCFRLLFKVLFKKQFENDSKMFLNGLFG